MEAITLFDEQGADLIILDVKMPGVDGFDVCGANDPIIKNYLAQIVEAAGGDHYLRKPFEVQELLGLVRKALSE